MSRFPGPRSQGSPARTLSSPPTSTSQALSSTSSRGHRFTSASAPTLKRCSEQGRAPGRWKSFPPASRCASGALAMAFSASTSSRRPARATSARSREVRASTRSRFPRREGSGWLSLLCPRPVEQLLGHGMREPDVDRGEEVTRALALEVRHTEPPEPQTRAILRAGRNRQLRGRTSERRDANRAARKGGGQRRRHPDAEIVTGTREHGMRSDVNANEEVTSRSAASTRAPLARGAYAGALVDAGGDLHLDPAWTIR